jgi:hypothetical protein
MTLTFKGERSKPVQFKGHQATPGTVKVKFTIRDVGKSKTFSFSIEDPLYPTE